MMTMMMKIIIIKYIMIITDLNKLQNAHLTTIQ